MSTHRRIGPICWGITALTLALTILFVNGQALGLAVSARTLGYDARLFDAGRVHTIDIVMDDWEGFLQTCENEEYTLCSVVIDGESSRGVGLRAKGNSSLTTVSSLDSSRYSFKLEFDHYDSGKSYHGLDKLSLNNIIQDNTYLKDYLTYQMMNAFGVASPLCSFAFLTVNGEDWGLYLAVEGVEDGFLRRNYDGEGQLYKPDSSSLGGGRGNGRDFAPEDMENLWNQQNQEGQDRFFQGREENAPFGGEPMDFPGRQGGALPDGGKGGQRPGLPDGGQNGWQFTPPDENENGRNAFGDRNSGFRGGGMSSNDVKLQYIDDDPESYPNIFDNAKTNPTQADRKRLIQSLYQLSQGENLEQALDKEAVLRYFVVHNFVVNGDSYTGSIIHNYYLYERDGRLAMIPWDYNLAFGGFQNGSASGAVNDPIDQVLEDRPMQSWIFASQQDADRYHQLYREFLDSVDVQRMIDQAAALIAPYVERDPTKFCTAEAFSAGAEALKVFCSLRAESAAGQLSGAVPSTAAGQQAAPDRLIDAGTLNLSDMGSMNMGGNRGGFPGGGQAGAGLPENGGEALPGPAADAGSPPPQEGFSFDGKGQNGFGGGFRDPIGEQIPGQPGESRVGAFSGGILLTGSAAALLAGLAFARRYRR